jgi:hypothetical protein
MALFFLVSLVCGFLLGNFCMPRKGGPFGNKGLPVPWEHIKMIWCSGTKTTKELAAMFNICANTIETRATRQGWRELRDQALGFKGARGVDSVAKAKRLAAEAAPPIPPGVVPDRQLTDPEILERARVLAASDVFRSRVLTANEKALEVLEASPPTNVGEADRFAEALTKVERIGARGYGYDREQDRPVVNIGVLTSGASHDYEVI